MDLWDYTLDTLDGDGELVISWVRRRTGTSAYSAFSPALILACLQLAEFRQSCERCLLDHDWACSANTEYLHLRDGGNPS